MQKQKRILELRHELLAQLAFGMVGDTAEKSRVRKEISGIDTKMFEQLRAVSSAGLKPILIRRNNAEWIAAYLVQEIGAGGWRILLKQQYMKWELSRARRSAEIVSVSKYKLPLHETIIEKQIDYLAALERFFSSRKAKSDSNGR